MFYLIFVILTVFSHGLQVLACGVPAVIPATGYRIVGGIEANAHSWPWQVALLDNNYQQGCGGSIIHPQWILTAAHCFEVPRQMGVPQPTLVRVGEHNLNWNVREPNQLDIPIQKILIHQSYNLQNNDYDVALLKLSRPVTYNDHVRPICLTKTDPNPGQICYATGWGALQRKESRQAYPWWIVPQPPTPPPQTERLRQVAVPIVSTQSCRSTNYKLHGMHITDRMICAGYAQGGRSTCQGDSGGPLVCQNPNNQWVQYGVTSWGIGCAATNYPGVYAKVSIFSSWIDNVIARY